jgi:AraC-like DNA-binding protein
MGMLIADNTGDWIEPGGAFDPDFELAKQALVTERRDKFSFSFGDAELVSILFSNIFIVYGDMVLKNKSIRLRLEHMPDMVELHFSLGGGPGTLHNHITNHKHNFDSNEHNIIYMPEFDGTGSYHSKLNYRFFEVHFLTDYFLELAKGSCPILERFAEKVASGRYADLSQRNLHITPAMHQCIQDIMHCSFTGGLKLLFLQSKCVELLTLQAIAFEQEQQHPASSVLKSGHDKDCIVHAKEYLLQHLHTPPSLTELAAIAGTNEFKLKKGFKELFNNTVFGYLSDTRLTQARELLLAGIPIKEVADQLGYSSVQHFGTAFRKKFGVSPGKMH